MMAGLLRSYQKLLLRLPVVLLYRVQYHRKYRHNNKCLSKYYQSSFNWRSLLALSIFGFFQSNEEKKSLPISFKKCYIKAEKAVSIGNYQEAEYEYHKALEILQDSPSVMTEMMYLEAMAVIVYQLGELYLRQREWEKASKSYIETINLMLKCNIDVDSPQIIDLSLKLGKVLTNMNNYEEAEKTFSFTLSSAKGLVEKDNCQENLALLGMCYHVKGQFHLMCKDYKTALECFLQGLELAKEVYGPNDIQVTVLMNDCCTSLESLGHYDEAEKLLEQAIELSTDSINYEHMATLFMNLGAIKNNQGCKDEAINLYLKALSYATKLEDKTISNEITKRLQLLRSN